MQNPLQPSQTAITLIQHFESCDLNVYPDAAGLPTIGWGHLLRANEMHLKSITQQLADHILLCDVQAAAIDVNTYVHVQLNQNQFDGATSLFFNVGAPHLRDSRLLKLINAVASKDEIRAQWLIWDHAAGKVLNGLLTRREAEVQLFLS